MTATTDVLVVGGGSTGTGIARDLAMRGVDVTLVEKGNLTHGTTGRMHGLLHSGGRYAVSDKASAEECIEENRVLRDIASHCVEETGGQFVQLEGDPDEYFEEKLAGCRECGIPAEVLSAEEAREEEPYLTKDVKRAIRVPDGAIDPFRLCVANAISAENHGGRIETHAEVVDLLGDSDRVTGVKVRHDSGPGKRTHGKAGETEEIRAEYVVNATGAWAGQIGEMAGVDIEVRPSKGVMVVMNCRQVDTVINRCRPKGDADIVVPHETTAILGTTDEEVADPEDYPEERWEVDLEPPEVGSADPTDITRDYFLLDHEERDDLHGLTSIVGGKFTTYRMMAEEISDHVCEQLGVSAECRTADVPLPGSEDESVLDAGMDRFGLRSPVARRSAQRLGSRADDVLSSADPNPVLCDCEAVTRAEVRDAIDQSGTDLNAVRIRTRASMGNCQGGFCCHRMASELHPEFDEPKAYAALDELFDERWKGERHALWGEQLSQAALNYALHATTMNRDRDPVADGQRDEEAESFDFAAFDAGESRASSRADADAADATGVADGGRHGD